MSMHAQAASLQGHGAQLHVRQVIGIDPPQWVRCPLCSVYILMAVGQRVAGPLQWVHPKVSCLSPYHTKCNTNMLFKKVQKLQY